MFKNQSIIRFVVLSEEKPLKPTVENTNCLLFENLSNNFDTFCQNSQNQKTMDSGIESIASDCNKNLIIRGS